MIISRLSFQHILTYYGNQTVELPTSGERTLTIVVGPNNSGKTSIIRALKFWFYGEAGLPRKGDLPLFLCNKAKAETPVGKSLIGWVEITFERAENQGKETYCLRRTIDAKRVSEDRWEIREVSLAQIRTTARPPVQPDESGRLQRMIEGMVPKALFDAFYFKGEPLDGKLLGDVGSIRQALGQFLHEDQWKEAEEAAAAIRDDLAKKLSKLTAANVDLNRKLSEESQNQTKLDAQRLALQEEEAGLRKAEESYNQETENLAKLGDEETAREVKTQHSRAIQRRDSAKNRLTQADQDILREINQCAGIPFLVGAVEPVKAMLGEMEKENILPADITPGFVDRVLAKNTCICGKKHDDDSRAHWEAYRNKTLAADAGEGLRKLLDWVKPRGSLSIQQRSDHTTSELKRLTGFRAKAVIELNEAIAAVSGAEEAMQAVPVEEIARIGKALQSLQSEIKTKSGRIRAIADVLQNTEYTAKRLNEEVQQLSAKSGVDQNAFKRLSAAKDRADRLHKALTYCRGRLSQYFHRVLQASVAEFYDSKATDGSKAHIDRQTLLPSIQVKGQKTQNLGGGQSQLLALAYVVSLARLRQDMHTQMEKLGVRLGKIDDLSFFMDSPFGNMEKHYKEAAVHLVPGSARQVILLLWKEEWDFARDFLEKEADRIYAVQFSTSSDDLKKIGQEARTYQFASGQKELIQSLSTEDDQPHSELLRIQ
jgi:hypothetical protein